LLFILIASLIYSFCGFQYSYYQFVRAEKVKNKQAYKARKTRYIVRKAISKYYKKNKTYPYPKSSGGSDATRLGFNTLQSILGDYDSYGDGRIYLPQIPNAYLEKGESSTFICVVNNYSDYLQSQTQYENCNLNSYIEKPNKSRQGYVYHPKTGKIRFNFRVSRKRKFQKSLGFSKFLKRIFLK
ncbi:hypothetical protein MJH12_15305, partial [bacterium]|nr:hypothetical protein [bacterium]